VVSSVAGFAPLLARTGYCASKHALHGFFGTLREELGPRGVCVTIVCPSFVGTDLTNVSSGSSSSRRALRETFGRTMMPEEVANAIYRATRRRMELMLPSPAAWLSYYSVRFAPRLYRWIMCRRFAAELGTSIN
jgi:short-subunit dehydrogenase